MSYKSRGKSSNRYSAKDLKTQMFMYLLRHIETLDTTMTYLSKNNIPMRDFIEEHYKEESRGDSGMNLSIIFGIVLGLVSIITFF